MATLRNLTGGQSFLLEAAHTVGRSGHSCLCLADRRVSSHHAVIRWTGNSWEIKDLGSRNGTYLDGRRLKSGEESPLRRGAVVSFGPSEQRWELSDETPPEVMLVPLGGGPPLQLDEGLIAVPSSEDPQATIYRSDEDRWVMEREMDAAPTPVTNGQTIDIAGRSWRVCIPDRVIRTTMADEVVRCLKDAILRFTVSKDEEDVQVHAVDDDETVDLGSRAHNYLLLTLARRRLADAAEKQPDAECGWIYQDDLARDPTMAGSQLNIDVFRIRKHFTRLGLADAATIVERRPRSRQLRIGTGRIEIRFAG